MRSDDDRNTPRVPNIFLREFLDRLGERLEPPSAAEAAVSGTWRLEEIRATFYAVFRPETPPARGYRPTAVVFDPHHALLIAALLPGTGRDPLYRLHKEPTADGYSVESGGEILGHLAVFDDKLVDALHVVECILRSPEALANLLEAAGAVVLERAGAILEGRMRE
jgi:hypothetical protein